MDSPAVRIMRFIGCPMAEMKDFVAACSADDRKLSLSPGTTIAALAAGIP